MRPTQLRIQGVTLPFSGGKKFGLVMDFTIQLLLELGLRMSGYKNPLALGVQVTTKKNLTFYLMSLMNN